jgi:biotin carboxyl carrier protein
MLHLTVNDDRTYDVQSFGEHFLLDGTDETLDVSASASGVLSILHNGRSYTATVEARDDAKKELSLRINGAHYVVKIEEPLDRLLKKLGMDSAASTKAESVKAPMPGMVLKILVEPGQQVSKGDPLIILEAMKMENILKASGPATVKAIRATERIAVEKGTVLIEME